MIDWGAGSYQPTARELGPVAEHLVSLARAQSGERVLDLATGTGNAALLAARTGAEVTGLDVASQLLQIARSRALEAGLEVSFVVGDLQALPFAAHCFEVVLSVFGLIYAPDADRAFAEMMRVLAPVGRALSSLWIPSGALDAMVGVFGRAMASALGPGPKRFPWADAEAVQDLAARNGAEVEFHRGELQITAESPEAYLTANEQHPLSVAARPVLEQAGTLAPTLERALAVLREGNEDPAAFRVTSPYLVLEIHPRSS
jgi:SAM-dependent methyltransferase